MAGASIEETLELWASSLRAVKARMRPLFLQERMAASAGLFLDGLLGGAEFRSWITAAGLGTRVQDRRNSSSRRTANADSSAVCRKQDTSQPLRIMAATT